MCCDMVWREEENDKGASGPRELQESSKRAKGFCGQNGSVIWEKEAGIGKSLEYQVEVKRNATGTE